MLLLQVALYSMYVACMAFHAKVSDPLIGGTYMTLLNTVTNLGGNWPSTVALWMVDPLTSKECQGAVRQSCGSPDEAGVSKQGREGGGGGCCVQSCVSNYLNLVNWFLCPCSHLQLCVKEGGVCVTTLDGYYVESVVCVVIGLAWWVWLGKKMRRLQEQSPAAWRCRANQWWPYHQYHWLLFSCTSAYCALKTAEWWTHFYSILIVWFSPSGPALAAAFRKLLHFLTPVTLKYILYICWKMPLSLWRETSFSLLLVLTVTVLWIVKQQTGQVFFFLNHPAAQNSLTKRSLGQRVFSNNFLSLFLPAWIASLLSLLCTSTIEVILCLFAPNVK